MKIKTQGGEGGLLGWQAVPAGRAMILPFASERREAACLDVYAAVSVGLILMR